MFSKSMLKINEMTITQLLHQIHEQTPNLSLFIHNLKYMTYLSMKDIMYTKC